MKAGMKTAVLGGGISGTLTAYYLARHGHDVTLIERRPGVAREASFANGGLVCPSQPEPWAAPGVPSILFKSLGRDGAPILLRLHAMPRMWRWGLAFLRNCSAKRHRRNMLTNFRLAQYSARAFAEIRAEADIDYDLLTVGTLKVFRDPRAHEHAVRQCESLREHGLAYRVVGAEECAAIEPALAATAHTLAGGIHFPDDEIGDCFKFAEAIAEHCKALGVSFSFDTEVRGLEVRGNKIACVQTDRGPITADRFVVAMGSYTPLVLRRLGIALPIAPVKGVAVTVPVAGWNEAPKVAVVDEDRKFGLVRIGEKLRAAGSAEFTGYDTEPSIERCRAILDNVIKLFPAFQDCVRPDSTTYWAGLRPMTPDGPPVLGATPIENLFLNAGGGHLGWTFSCGAARIVADIAAGRAPEVDLDGMTLERFRH